MIDTIFSEKHFWIFKIAIGIILLVCLEILLFLILKLIRKKVQKKQTGWKTKIHEIFFVPIQILIWVYVLSYISITIADHYKFTNLIDITKKIRDLIVIVDITWLLIRWKRVVQDQIISKSKQKVDKTSIEFIGKILIIIFVFIAILLSLQKLGINIFPLLAVGGLGAAAFAFSAKDVLANFFGGIMIYITRPFVKNDLIEIPSQKILGSVEHIGWYITCIRELEKVPVYVPNSVFSNAIIKNKTRRTHRRIEETIRIRYLDFSKISKIIDEIKKIFHKHEQVDDSFPPFVYFTSYSDYSLDIMIKVYTHVVNYGDFLKLKEEILLQIKAILDKAGADIPFPITSVDFLNKPSK